MTFAPGDRVHVSSIGTGVVCEVRYGGRYLVDIKGRTMVVAGSQLEPARRARASRSGRGATAQVSAPDADRDLPAALSLDLHGKTVVEALETLDAFLNDALLDGHREVRVIHGRSGGRLKAAIHHHLKQLHSVRTFHLDPHNLGVTIVSL